MFIQTAPSIAAPQTYTPQYPILRTPMLNLRQIVSADREALYELFSEPEVTAFTSLDTVVRLSEVDTLIGNWRDQFQRGTAMHWAITLKHDDQVIGVCGFDTLDCEGKVGSVHYYLHPMYWRHGLMTQALAAVVRCGFDMLGLNRIDNWIMLENFAACGLMETVGFRCEQIARQYRCWKGVHHDMALYARLRR